MTIFVVQILIFLTHNFTTASSKHCYESCRRGCSSRCSRFTKSEANTWSLGTISNYFFTNSAGIAFTTIVLIAIILFITYLILHYRKKKENEEKTTIYKIIKGIDMFFYVDVYR
ncbi:hypothetical protein PFDG_04350 [Plasmodium falciparum Dd2]|uniref:Uncharacterized protein n=1 Tax=Plasmodium falciparum (isolate Dd2) TaxID=57267 RepID=A0A0L7M4W3_PLAF4|nr:hypothetical protein PFDG_04350 [Plasmodium falciparum Dd2]